MIWEYVAHKITEVSSLCVRDQVNITAHCIHLMSGESDERASLLARGFTPEMIDALTASKRNPTIEACGLIFTRPLSEFKYPLMDYVLNLFGRYEKGNLPFPGSVSEQPAQIIEALNLIQTIKHELQNNQQKKQMTNG